MVKNERYYFIVFNQNGMVRFQKGIKPSFINSFIGKINSEGSHSVNCIVRDNLVEYKIVGDYVYLSVSTGFILNELFNSYSLEENTLNFKEDNDGCTNKELSKDEITTKKKSDLDLSTTSMGSSVSSFTKFISNSFLSLKRKTYTYFTGKVNVENLQTILNDHLISKNVSPELVALITNDVVDELKDKKISFILADDFKKGLSAVIKRILKISDFDILVNEIKAKNKVYSIFLTGPNGVGKSTTLAKMSHRFLNRGLKVFISASDTFRAGAIEQLKIHANKFRSQGKPVGFFESGYSKDDSKVVKTAIIKANYDNYDLLLVDTAGRMHNNNNLMRSLTKLCSVNQPDFVIFVGEALTGGDSLDQINSFGKYIKEGRNEGKAIDAIILTKVEAVLSKIGQVLNLTFLTGIPILFLGTGQTYEDLVCLDVDMITELLLSE